MEELTDYGVQMGKRHADREWNEQIYSGQKNLGK